MPGYQRDASGESTELATAGVRLGSGYQLLVDAGPLVLEDGWWYRVQNIQQPGLDPTDTLVWDLQGDGIPDAGWVAGAVQSEVYIVSVEETPSPSDGLPYPSVPDPYWVMHGVGRASSTVVDFPELDEGVWNPIGVTWYAADPEGQDCNMRVTMRPDGWGMGSASIHDWGDGGGVTPPPPAVLLGEKWLEVESDCSWTLVAIARQG